MSSCFAVPHNKQTFPATTTQSHAHLQIDLLRLRTKEFWALKMECTQHHEQHAPPASPTWYVVGSGATSNLRPHPHTSDLRPQTSHLRPQTQPQPSDPHLRPQTSDLTSQTSDLRPNRPHRPHPSTAPWNRTATPCTFVCTKAWCCENVNG